MAITHAGTAGTAASATSSSSFTLTTTTRACDASSNQFGLLLIASDNLGSSDGSNNEITSVTGGTGTWTKLGQWTNANGGAGNGVTVTLYYFEPSGGNAVGTVFTINLASAAVDKCAQFRVFAHGAGTAIRVDPTSSVQTNDGDAVNDIGSASFSGLASQQRLYYRGFGKEANTISPVTPSSGFTQLSTNRSRNSAATVCVGGEYRINTSTGETSNPTLAVSGDYASIFLALEEYTPGGGPTTSVVTTATITATGQTITTNAKKQSAVTAASITAAGQTLATKIAKTSLIAAASITATGQSIAINAKRASLIVAATIIATAQSLTTNAKRVSSISFAQITATGQALSTKISKRSEVLAATITATAQSLTTRVTSETTSEVIAATIAVSAQALGTSMTTVSSVTNATITVIGRTVVTKGSAIMAEVSGIMDTLHDLTNRLLDVVLLGSSNNDTPTGYYEELARACEALAGTSPSPLANPVDDGYLLRAATALETISSTDGSAENANYNGLLKRTVDALEDYTGTTSEGSLLHRLRTAVYQL